MAKIIIIKAPPVVAMAELNDTKTAQAIWDALPITGIASLWGDEIYFPIPLNLELENGQEVVDVGDLGYWPSGNAFCIFFGPTPVSQGDEVRPVSAVSVFGKLTGNATIFRQVASRAEITIEKEGE